MFPVRGAVARSRECAAVLFRKDSGALLERFLARKCVDDRIRSLARSFSDLQDVASCLLLPPGARVGRLPLIVEVHLGMVPRCEPALVHEPRRCEGKAGGLAWRLQHGKIPQRDREQAPDYADESPRRNQPAKVRKRQKLQPRIRAILGAVQKGLDSRNE